MAPTGETTPGPGVPPAAGAGADIAPASGAAALTPAAADLLAPMGTGPRRRARIAAIRDRLMFVGVLVGAVIVWHLAIVVFGIESYILPKPFSVAEATVEHRAALADHTWATAQEMIIGFGLAAVTGIGLASLMYYFRPLEQILSPLIVTFQTIPKVALAPLFVVWFGYGILPRVLVALAIAFFPIVIDTMVGLRSTKPSARELVRSLGGSRWQVFRKVEFPSALPSIFGGLKVATTLVVIGAVVGEYIVANKGLGYLQLQAAYKLDSPLLFASVLMMAVLGLVAYELVNRLERIVVPWRKH